MKQYKNLKIWLMAACIMAMLWPAEAWAAETVSEETAQAELLADAAVWNGTAAEDFAGGRGTETSPWLIETAAQLAYFAQSVNGGTNYSGQYVSLQADLNLSGLPWTPIGGEGKAFAGIFLGNAHTIRNLYINSPSEDNQGLFGRLSSGTIQNLRLMDANVTGRNNVGIITGYDYFGTITNCNVSGSVSGASRVGGIAGYSQGTSGGYAYTLSRCINNADVTANQSYAGGIVGGVEYGANFTIDLCLNTGAVDSFGEHVGGISGEGGEIQNCMNLGGIGANATDYVGGIQGTSNDSRKWVRNSCNLGTVTSKGSVYGIGHYASNCYNAGMVSTTSRTAEAYSTTRPFTFNRSNCYTLTSIAEELEETAGNGLTILDEMNTAAFADTLNRNVISTGRSHPDSTWLQDDAVYGGYPYFEPRTVQSLSVTTPPDKTAYEPGETFDPTGMTVTALCSDGSSYDLSLNALTFFPNTALEEEDNSVTIFYNTLNASVEITVSEGYVSEYEIESLEVKDNTGGNLTAIPEGDFLVSVSVKRVAGGGKALVLLAAYTAEGQFQGLMYVEVDEPVEAVTRVTLPANNTDGSIAQLRAFVVPSFRDMRPVGAAVSFPENQS